MNISDHAPMRGRRVRDAGNHCPIESHGHCEVWVEKQSGPRDRADERVTDWEQA